MSEIDIYDMIALKVRKQERELEKLKKELKVYKIKNEEIKIRVEHIVALGFDYDGFNKEEDLKKLIDELVRIADEIRNILNGRSDE